MLLAGVFPKLIQLLSCSEFDIQKEATWAISNATSGGTTDQVLYLVQQGAVPPLCELLKVADVKVVMVALEGLENILRTARQTTDLIFERVVSLFVECGGTVMIENLQVCMT